uniref:Uncharacterized protein n=1 Tax=Ailuropoda melanoleuca TaxID=9646 RepID=A0A7N5JUM0_AILME
TRDVGKMAGEEKPEKLQQATATRVTERKAAVTALRSNPLKKQLQTSQHSQQRSPGLDLP